LNSECETYPIPQSAGGTSTANSSLSLHRPRLAGGSSSSAFRSSRRRFTFSRQLFLASNSSLCSKFEKPAFSRAALSRWSSFSSVQFVANNKLNRTVIGLDLNVHLRFHEVARLLVDHLIQQTINKQTKFTAIYSNLLISQRPHASQIYRMQYCIKMPSQSHTLPSSTHLTHLSTLTQHKRYKSSRSQANFINNCKNHNL
jgi:hypothetical protein